MSIIFLICAGIIIGYTIYYHFWAIENNQHPYLSIEKLKKLKTKEERKNARKQKDR